MMQPCGNVLGQRGRNYRFYIRAAPIVCAADTAQFILFVLLGSSRDLPTWLRNIKFELKERFEGESGAVDRKAAENSIIIRWILLIVGAYELQAIKLMGMQGIPWTKAWAMMFAVSIVFGEIIISLVRFLSLDDVSETTRPRWRSDRISKALKHIAIVPILLQFTVSYRAFFVSTEKIQSLVHERLSPADVFTGALFWNLSLLSLLSFSRLKTKQITRNDINYTPSDVS